MTLKLKRDVAEIERDLKAKPQERVLVLDVRAAVINDEARTVELAWASEAPYERWFGFEILDCKAPSIRLGRLNDGASVLFNHDRDQLLGVVESVKIGSDNICRAVVRFDSVDPEAEKRFQQIKNGTLRQVSVGYMVHKMRLEEETDDSSTYRVTDWEPYEISMVTIAADTTVGVGRSAVDLDDPQPKPITISPSLKGKAMDEDQVKELAALREKQLKAAEAQAARDLDDKRREAIIELGVKYAEHLTLNEVKEACQKGHTVAQVQDAVIEKMKTKHSDTRGVHLGLSDGEVGQYSVARAVAAMLTGEWKEAGLERAASEAAMKRFGTGTKGLLIPFDVMAKRDFTAGVAGEAGNLVQTQLRPDMFADVLRNRLALGRLGTTMLFGLSSNVDMPRKVTGSALGYVTEVAALAETQPSTAKVSLTPKRIGGFIEFSKQAVIQSALAVEPMLRQDILSEYQVQFENSAINGSGAGANPRGLRNTAGIGAVVGGANGAQINWGHIVGLESACANVNAEPDVGSGYLLNTRSRGWLKQTIKAANLPFIWDNGAQPLNGYRAEVTNNVPSNLTKGTSVGVASSIIFGSDWNMLVMATFGAVELLVDETTIATSGLNRLILNAFVDVGVRRAADFASMDDALTA